MGNSSEGCKHIRGALKSDRLTTPDRPLTKLALIASQRKDIRTAIDCYRNVVGLSPKYEQENRDLLRIIMAHNNLAGILATHSNDELRDGEEHRPTG